MEGFIEAQLPISIQRRTETSARRNEFSRRRYDILRRYDVFVIIMSFDVFTIHIASRY